MRHLPRRLGRGLRLVRESGRSFRRDRGGLVAAAIAFYVLLAVAPLTFLGLALLATQVPSRATRQEAANALADVLGYEPADVINGWIVQASRTPGLLSAVGIGVALLMSTRLFAQVQAALNEIWGTTRCRPNGLGRRVRRMVGERLLAFGMMLGAGLVLLLLVVARSATGALHDEIFGGTSWTRASVEVVQTLLAVGAVALIAAITYRVLPDAGVPWRSAWMGALLASALFNLGTLLFGSYVGWIVRTQSLGAAGAFVFLLIWLYYSAQAFLLGAELTHVHARAIPPGERGARAAPRGGVAGHGRAPG